MHYRLTVSEYPEHAVRNFSLISTYIETDH